MLRYACSVQANKGAFFFAFSKMLFFVVIVVVLVVLVVLVVVVVYGKWVATYERPMLQCCNVITSARAHGNLNILRTRIVVVSCTTLGIGRTVRGR